MKLTLAENIRACRKQRKMTQEQLADVLGVTVGAVYKWESGMSVPELNLIVEMADFFDLSVDVLLGYRMKDNTPETIIRRLYAYCRTLDPAAIPEAEKALGKYPHSFPIVYACSEICLIYGVSNQDKALVRRALELLEQARVLLPQNEDLRISELTIYRNMATAYFNLGERERAVDLLKRKNANGAFSEVIGSALAAFMGRTEEAVPFLSDALVRGIFSLMQATLGYVFVYRARGDWSSALAIATLLDNLLSGILEDGKPDYMDKTRAEVLLVLAYVRAKNGQAEASEEALRKAAELAARFDSTPEYSLKTVRFFENTENATAFDSFGTTASGSIGFLLGLLKDGELSAKWKEITRSEK